MRNKQGRFSIKPIRFKKRTIIGTLVAAWLITIDLMIVYTFLSTAQVMAYDNHMIAEVTMPENKVEPSIQEYVFQEVHEKVGLLDAVKAVQFINSCENPKWNPDLCIAEPNGTVSCGIWMINSIHAKKTANQYISTADMVDYKKATKWAIEKRLHDGNFSAWSCSTK